MSAQSRTSSLIDSSPLRVLLGVAVLGSFVTVSATAQHSAASAAAPSAAITQEHWSEDHEASENLVANLPVTIGWFDGAPSFYLATDSSDLATAQFYHANYAPNLGNAVNTTAIDDIYAVTNFTQGNIVPSSPIPAGPGNTNTAYSPFWQVSTVTWNTPAQAHLLRSEAEVLSAQSSGQVVIVKTNIIVNCSILYTPQGDVLPGTRIVLNRTATGSTTATATVPVTLGWFAGHPVPYLLTDASIAAVAGPTGNLSVALANAANTQAVDDIYTVTNFKQGNVIPSAPSPVGPKSTDQQYTPAWQLSQVTWKPGTHPHTLKSEAEVLDAKADGQVTVVKTNIVVNCSVIATATGGTLPGVVIYKSE